MKIYTGSIRLSTDAKLSETDITERVQALVKESGIDHGWAVVFTGHTTSSVHLANADKELAKDFHDLLNELIPNKPTYRHNSGEYGRNADAHFKSTLVGNSATIPVNSGRLSLGQWQAIFFSEFDGPRNRLISVRVAGE